MAVMMEDISLVFDAVVELGPWRLCGLERQ